MSPEKKVRLVFIGLAAILGLQQVVGALFAPYSKRQEYEEVFGSLTELEFHDRCRYYPIIVADTNKESSEVKEPGGRPSQKEVMSDSPIAKSSVSSFSVAHDGVYQIVTLRTSALNALNNGNLQLAKSKLHLAEKVGEKLLAARFKRPIEECDEGIRLREIARAESEWNEAKKNYSQLFGKEEMEQEFKKLDEEREQIYEQLKIYQPPYFWHWEGMGEDALNAAKGKLAEDDLTGSQQKWRLAQDLYKTAKALAEPYFKINAEAEERHLRVKKILLETSDQGQNHEETDGIVSPRHQRS